MRKSPLKRKSKSDIRKLQEKIWQELRRIKDKPIVDCYTCSAKNIQGSNKQLGHMWAKASLPARLKYEKDILEFQCYHCNINCGGMGADFYKRKLKELGKKRMNELEKLRNQDLVKASDYYKELLDKLSTF